MNSRQWHYFGCLLAAVACSSTLLAQTVISQRKEVRQITATAMGGRVGARDIPQGIRGPTGGTVFLPSAGSGASDSATTITSTVEVEISVLAFQIPDFDPADQLVYRYHVGQFSATGSGNGTAYPDETGYVEFERVTHAGEVPMQTYLYGVHIDTGETQLFIDIDDVSVNAAVSLINNVGRVRTPGSGMLPREVRRRQSEYFPFPAIGDQRFAGLHGNYLSPDDLVQQVLDQTACRINRDELGVFYLEYCD